MRDEHLKHLERAVVLARGVGLRPPVYARVGSVDDTFPEGRCDGACGHSGQTASGVRLPRRAAVGDGGGAWPSSREDRSEQVDLKHDVD